MASVGWAGSEPQPPLHCGRAVVGMVSVAAGSMGMYRRYPDTATHCPARMRRMFQCCVSRLCVGWCKLLAQVCQQRGRVWTGEWGETHLFIVAQEQGFYSCVSVIIAYIISAILQLHSGHTLSTGPLTLSQDMCKKICN